MDIQFKLLYQYRSVWPRGYAQDSTSRGPRCESYVLCIFRNLFVFLFLESFFFFFFFWGGGGGGGVVFALLFGSSIFVCLIACVLFMATGNRRGRYYLLNLYH